jgi:hypothetical protein
MQILRQLLISAAATAVLAQTFEPTDFNVTDALLDQGVNVSAIVGLADLAERSSLSGCSIAVCPAYPPHSRGNSRSDLELGSATH